MNFNLITVSSIIATMASLVAGAPVASPSPSAQEQCSGNLVGGPIGAIECL
ncbi:hypothetical protein HYFRA_00001845 [Hymenoscyphus fraxineus]|uniref:Uncharacterized protein n=1 Tax=Hymenoscyphus fraxineus TaxID=746836 RepID=A0A9N9PE62_9HELO|nr:hypothetical protein HYFRA_00001845 [Hymenoscyphus fraxineus]